MAKCSNCTNNGVYEYKVTTNFIISYCNSCLPRFLKAQKNAGLLKPAPVVVEAPPVVVEEEPVVPEEVSEVIEEEPVAPSQKTTKKKISTEQ
jgi:hypothetical protein